MRNGPRRRPPRHRPGRRRPSPHTPGRKPGSPRPAPPNHTRPSSDRAFRRERFLGGSAMRYVVLGLALVGGLALPGRADAPAEFFNGKDLAGWEGLMEFWSVK